MLNPPRPVADVSCGDDWPYCQWNTSKEYLAICRVILVASLVWRWLQKHLVSFCLVYTILYGRHILGRVVRFYAADFHLSCHQAWFLLADTRCWASWPSLRLRMLHAGGQAGICWLAVSPGNMWTLLEDVLVRIHQHQAAMVHTKLTSLWVPCGLWEEKAERYMESTEWINEPAMQWETLIWAGGNRERGAI